MESELASSFSREQPWSPVWIPCNARARPQRATPYMELSRDILFY